MDSKFVHLLSSGFCAFKISRKPLTRAFCEWQNTILAPLGASVVDEEMKGSVDRLISALYPLVSPVRTKRLFLDGGNGWVVALDNSHRGTDASLAAVLSRKCDCLAARVVSQLHTMNSVLGTGNYGAEIFESYEGGDTVRTVFCANDGGRWKFGQSGTPYAAEDLTRYSGKPIRERFTRPQLVALLGSLDVHVFDLGWYPGRGIVSGTLISRVGQLPTDYREHEVEPSPRS